MKIRTNVCLYSLILLLCFSGMNVEGQQEEKQIEVLVLNSYNDGFKWSDDILEGINMKFSEEYLDARITVEYLDTKKNTGKQYQKILYEFLEKKYTNKKYDVIIATDDAAYTFIKEKGNEVFKDIPVVFCGITNIEDGENRERNFTAVLEEHDIISTLEIALKLHPEVKNVYVINDTTTTGKAIQLKIEEAKREFEDRLQFYDIGDKPMEEVIEQVKRLDEDSLIFFSLYIRDGENAYFEYDEAIQIVAEVANVPIYGVYEIFLGKGIVGGRLASAFKQGEKAAEYAIEIIKGTNPKDLPILEKTSVSYQFDNIELEEHAIDISKLPADSVVINRVYDERKKILVIHSYHSTMKWVEAIEEGLSKAFSEKNYDIYIEYMDTKRAIYKEYLKAEYDQLVMKHSQNTFDAIIVSDNNAMNFITRFGNSVFQDVPIVFCGISNVQDYEKYMTKNYTGVTESIDIKSTVDIALEQNPLTQKIYIINDVTTTGKANQELLENVLQNKAYGHIEKEYISDMNMSDVIGKMKTLEEKSIVLLLSYTKDRSNNVFSYEEVGHLISTHAIRPVYVVWDFYLGTGVVGGMVSSGFSQGEEVGTIVNRIFEGEKVYNIPIQHTSPNQYMFDVEAMKRFNIRKATLPQGSELINKEEGIIERHSIFILTVILLLISIVMIYIDGRRKLSKSKNKQNELESYALYDQLTGTYTRRQGLYLAKEAVEKGEVVPYTVCFIDIDNLKAVNDQYGHEAGDEMIKSIVYCIGTQTREKDIFFRYGGDEFILVFAEMKEEEAKRRLEQIEKQIEKVNERRPYKVGFSYGCKTHIKGMKLRETIKVADDAMYKYKQKRKRERK